MSESSEKIEKCVKIRKPLRMANKREEPPVSAEAIHYFDHSERHVITCITQLINGDFVCGTTDGLAYVYSPITHGSEHFIEATRRPIKDGTYIRQIIELPDGHLASCFKDENAITIWSADRYDDGSIQKSLIGHIAPVFKMMLQNDRLYLVLTGMVSESGISKISVALFIYRFRFRK